MAESPRKKRFEFEIVREKKGGALKYGSEGNDVFAMQSYLSNTGYLGRDREPGRCCYATCAALKHFQKCYGLPDTGEADETTLRLMSQPRCGVPDISPATSSSSGPAPFVLGNCKYNRTNLTYTFINSTSDLALDRQRAIVREAFAAWSAVSPLRFTEVPANATADFPIAWERLNHGDDAPFDDSGSIQGNVLAHAFFPPPCGGRFSGALHFDEFERWTDAAASNSIRLLNVAIHEIGHLLGLQHSNNRSAIMFAFYDDNVDRLFQDDINGIQALYGRPTGPVPIRGSLSGDGASQVHRIAVQPGQVTITLRGPQGQDFDLYARAGGAPTRALFDARSFTSSANEVIRLNLTGGELFILVDSWRGSGNYEVDVAFG